MSISSPTILKLPLLLSTVRAGFPSPADDYVEGSLDLNEHLIAHKEATFFIRVKGRSMVEVGINSGDLLVVDRSLDPVNGDIVVAALDGEFTVKRLDLQSGQVRLLPANSLFRPIELSEGQELTIWGVVTSVIHEFRRIT